MTHIARLGLKQRGLFAYRDGFRGRSDFERNIHARRL